MRFIRESFPLCGVALLLLLQPGCSSTKSGSDKDKAFYTSGSADADRRAENAVPKAESSDGKKESGSSKAPAEPGPRTLYQRLGENAGITRIMDDFVQRVMEDPRVNWSRRGVVKKSWFRSERATEWEPTPANVNRLKTHFVQFIGVASGGPSEYEGKPLKPLHLGMQISKAEFDAVIGDLKSTLDKLQIAPDVQKDLIALFESTRQQIVTERQ